MAQTAEKQIDVKSLLEATTSDAEQVALRREALETMPRDDLADEMRATNARLHERLSKDPRAVHVSDPTFARDKWQATIPVGPQDESITVQSNQMVDRRHTPTIEIYTGQASAALEANPTDIYKSEPAQSLYGSLRESSTRSEVHLGRIGFSLRDMQTDVEDILLLDALAEQFSPADATVTATQVGKAAVQA